VAASFSFLNLAYLAEVSFVANLAYFEFETYKLRDKLKEEADRIEKLYFSENSENSKLFNGSNDDCLVLLEPEWGMLKQFDKAKKGSWDSGVIHWNYKKFVLSKLDRWIVGLILFSDALILAFITASAGLGFYATEHYIVWWVLFGLLFLSCIIPALLIWLVESCKKYAFGNNNNGRIYVLGQNFMKKIKAYLVTHMFPPFSLPTPSFPRSFIGNPSWVL